MKIFPLIVLVSILFFSSVLAQTTRLEGTIVEKTKNKPLSGARVSLIYQADTSISYVAATDSSGHFQLTNPKTGMYRLQVFFLGYETVKRSVTIGTTSADLGKIALAEQAIPMQGVNIEELSPRATQKHDTTEYSAQAFKVNKDANVEDLVTKMPGVTVENGTVTAQGENVQQVLVDGKQFFGNDPTVTLRNMPAEIIDKIQVFDKMSDQAQFTGFDDGRSVKTMNIVTRQDRRQGQFGRFNGGYGTDDRYIASGNINNFSGNMRLSLLGLSNNVNQQNFSQQDLLGVMNTSGGGGPRGNFRGPGGGMPGGGGRRPGGVGGGQFGGGASSNFLVGQSSGTSVVHSLGTNYSDSLAQNLYATGSYFFNLTNNQNPQSLNRQYILTGDSSSYYNEQSGAERKNYNHRLNLRMEYAIDTSNSIIVTPQISFQDNTSTTSVNGTNSVSESQIISQTLSNSETHTTGYSSENHLVYRHKFPTIGRTVSVDLGFSGNNKESDGNLTSLNRYYLTGGVRTDSSNQKSNTVTNGTTFAPSLAYTEPIGSLMQLQVNYNPSFTRTTSDKTTHELNTTNTADSIVTALSNSYENKYTTHSTGLSLRYRKDAFNMSIGASYQVADLQNNQSFPYTAILSKTFYSVLPNVMINYEGSQRQSWRLFYRASTTSPSISQLQNVVDNSNALFLSSGNPDLKQSYSHTLMTRLSLSSAENTNTTMLFVTFGMVKDYIGNSTFVAQQDTTLPNNVFINQGTQFSMPVNLEGNWNARTFLTYGFPIDFFKSNLNLLAGVSYNRTPGLINGTENISNGYAFNPGFVLGSNISENLDFTLSYNSNFNKTTNSSQANLDNSYFSHSAALRCTWTIWSGVVFRTDLNNTLYSGLSTGLNQELWLWNMSIGKKLFANDQGEITLSVSDLLNQNKSISRTVTETYIEDSETQPLKRFFLLTFTYNLRQFGGSDGGERPRRDGHDFH